MSKQKTLRTFTLGSVAAAAALAVFSIAGPASAETEVAEPAEFTSAFSVMATPGAVVNPDGVATPGEPDATGSFTFRINSDLDIICYDITVTGVTGDYQSAAKTATHIHQAAAGLAGPPRIAFPNPAPIGDGPRTSEGCLQGPFTTGVLVDGVDTGTGFELSSIEADAAAFAADTHTASFVAGAVRGQLTQIPVGGVQTGGGGIAAASSTGVDAGGSLAIGAGVIALGALGIVALRRHRSATSR